MASQFSPILPPHVFLAAGPNLTADFLVFRNLSTGRPVLQIPPPPPVTAGAHGVPEGIVPPINVWAIQSGMF